MFCIALATNVHGNAKERPNPLGARTLYGSRHAVAAAARACVRLKSRNGADATTWFPEITAALATVASKRLIVDGEVCVLDELGRSDFDRLHAGARRRRFVEGEPVV